MQAIGNLGTDGTFMTAYLLGMQVSSDIFHSSSIHIPKQTAIELGLSCGKRLTAMLSMLTILSCVKAVSVVLNPLLVSASS